MTTIEGVLRPETDWTYVVDDEPDEELYSRSVWVCSLIREHDGARFAELCVGESEATTASVTLTPDELNSLIVELLTLRRHITEPL